MKLNMRPFIFATPALLQRLACALGVVSTLMLATPSWADEVPWRQRNFDLQASNEPLNVFLSRLLTIDGISATMSPTVGSGRVNGRFKGKAETVFKELSDTYGLTSYYDGSTLHVYSISEMETRILQLEPNDVPRVDRTLKQMRLFDPRFPLRASPNEGQVLVAGPPRYVELVSDVVARVASSPSQPRSGTEVRVFRLRHAKASDTSVTIGGVETRVSGLARTLSELLGDAPPDTDVAATGTRILSRSVPGLRGKGQAALGQSPQTAASGAGGLNSAAARSVSNVAAGLAGGEGSASLPMPLPITAPLPPAQVASIPDMPRRESSARVRADERLNAVVVRDTRERMPMYAQLIESLDIETALMEIEATVIDVSDDKSEQLGIDWRAHSKRGDVTSSPNSYAGNGTGNSVGRNIANDLLFSEGPLSAGGGLVGTLLFGSERTFFLARLNALAERGDANLISRPRVLTLDNAEAVLQNTREFYVRVAGKDQVDLFNVALGLMLRVTPTLIEDGQGRRFKLLIRIEDGNTNSGAQVDQIPVVSRNAISTQAVVGEGQSLLIGGYVLEERTSTKSGVPFLSDVPGLGWLFGQRTNGTRRVERMFMITPRLIKLFPNVEPPPVAAIKPPPATAP